MKEAGGSILCMCLHSTGLFSPENGRVRARLFSHGFWQENRGQGHTVGQVCGESGGSILCTLTATGLFLSRMVFHIDKSERGLFHLDLCETAENEATEGCVVGVEALSCVLAWLIEIGRIRARALPTRFVEH